MTRAAYTGNETLTFSDYLDLDTGRTLTAEPGGTYDVAPAGGSVPEVPVPWFTPVQEWAPQVVAEIPVEEAVYEPPGEPEAGEPQAEDGAQQQF